MSRQQLPPQLRKIEVKDRRTGKTVVRYQMTVDTGFDPETGRRRQVRRRFTTEAEARSQLAKVGEEGRLAEDYSLKPSTLRGHRLKLDALRSDWVTSRYSG